jgi:hypothetical protein
MRRNKNVLAFSLSAASFQILQMLTMIVTPPGIANAGEQMYHFVPGLFDEPGFHTCKENCLATPSFAADESPCLPSPGPSQLIVALSR